MGCSNATLLGLTGGIGSGKSTAAAILVRLGARLVDADAISRAATAPGGGAVELIASQFGEGILLPDRSLDRDQMRTLAFTDKSARKRLEAILHPIVGAEIEHQTRSAVSSGASCVVIDIPLLVESGRWRPRLRRVLTVDCSAQTQLRRISLRKGLNEAQARQIIAAQAPREARLAASDFVVQNDLDSMPSLAAQIEQIARHLGL